MTYPEHEKLRAVSEKSQAIGDFLAWLADAKGLTPCEFREAGNNGAPRMRPATAEEIAEIRITEGHGAARKAEARGVENENYQWWPEGWYPSYAHGQQITRWLAEYFGIDLDRLEAEKRAILESLREKAGA